MSTSASTPAPPPSPIPQSRPLKRPRDINDVADDDIDADPFGLHTDPTLFSKALETHTAAEDTFKRLSALPSPSAIATALKRLSDGEPATKKLRPVSPTVLSLLAPHEIALAGNITAAPEEHAPVAQPKPKYSNQMYFAMYNHFSPERLGQSECFLFPYPSKNIINKYFNGITPPVANPMTYRNKYAEKTPGFPTTYALLKNALANGLVHEPSMTYYEGETPRFLGKKMVILTRPKNANNNKDARGEYMFWVCPAPDHEHQTLPQPVNLWPVDMVYKVCTAPPLPFEDPDPSTMCLMHLGVPLYPLGSSAGSTPASS